MKKTLVLLSLLILVACENQDYRDGKKALEDGFMDDAIFHLSKVPSDDKKYNESLVIMNEYFQSNIEIRKLFLSKKDDRSLPIIGYMFWDSHPTISGSSIAPNLNDFSSQLLMDKISSIILKKKQNGDYFYPNYPTLVFNDDVLWWTTYYSDGSPQKNTNRGATTTLTFKQNGEGKILMERYPSDKEANLEWSINLYEINFEITGVDLGTKGFQTYPSNFSDKFRNNRGEMKVDEFLNRMKLIQKDKQEFYDFAEKIKDDFIKYITPINISEWTSSPLLNDGRNK